MAYQKRISIELSSEWRAEALRQLDNHRRPSESGCVLWHGPLHSSGYGRVSIFGVRYRAHRIAFLLERGPIPSDLELDHLCRTLACVKVTHLEAVSHKLNILRGEAPTAVNARKTHCPKGHPYSGNNLYIDPRGRKCRRCDADRHGAFQKTEAGRLKRREIDRKRRNNPNRKASLVKAQRKYREKIATRAEWLSPS